MADREDERRLPAGYRRVGGDLPRYTGAAYGFASRAANPPESLRGREPWRPCTPSNGERLPPARVYGLEADRAQQRAEMLAKGGADASVEGLARRAAEIAMEQRAAREQLRVDELRRKASATLDREPELRSLRVEAARCEPVAPRSSRPPARIHDRAARP